MNLYDLDEDSELQGVTFGLNYLIGPEEEWWNPFHEQFFRLRHDATHLHWNEIQVDSPCYHLVSG
jgi:hypothetical protein